METRIQSPARPKPVEFVFLLAVGALKSMRNEVSDSRKGFSGASKPSGRKIEDSRMSRTLGIPILVQIRKRLERDLYPDTGESGETYDMEAFGQPDWSGLQ